LALLEFLSYVKRPKHGRHLLSVKF